MSNDYFDYNDDLIPGTIARPDKIDSALEAIETAFDAVEEDVFRGIRFTDGAKPAESAFQISQTAVQRAGKVLGFDATGKPAIVSDVGAWEGAWTTGKQYLVKAIVSGPASHFNSIYIAQVEHTSGDFATDLAAGRWALMIDLTLVKQSIITHTIVTATGSPHTLAKGQDVMVDVSAGPVTVILPAAPVIGDQPINLMHVAGNIATNPITINRNGKRIMGLEENMTVDVTNASFGLAFANDTLGWRVRGV